MTWISLQRTIGPIHLGRVGIGYHDASAWLAIDAGLTAGALEIDLEGLALGLTLQAPPSVSFDIQGLAIDFQGSGVAITGGLRKTVSSDGTTTSFDGEALITTPELTLSAIGSFGKTGSDISMFVFAWMNKPLGGPTFCYVTGLSAGFGFNRSLRIPTQDEVAGFPLLANSASLAARPRCCAERARELGDRTGRRVLDRGRDDVHQLQDRRDERRGGGRVRQRARDRRDRALVAAPAR